MNNLLRAEFYKLRSCRSFWALLALSVLLGSVMILDTKIPDSAAACFHSSLYSSPLLYILLMIQGTLFIGEDFVNRTISFYITAGHKRLHILSAKLIVYLTSCLLIILAPLLIDGLAGIIIFGMPEQFSLISFLQRAAVIVTAVAAMGILPFLSAFLFKDVGRTLVIPLLLYFIMIFLLNSSQSQAFMPILPIGQLRIMSENHISLPLLYYAAADIAWLVIGSLGAGLAFSRTDLK